MYPYALRIAIELGAVRLAVEYWFPGAGRFDVVGETREGQRVIVECEASDGQKFHRTQGKLHRNAGALEGAIVHYILAGPADSPRVRREILRHVPHAVFHKFSELRNQWGPLEIAWRKA